MFESCCPDHWTQTLSRLQSNEGWGKDTRPTAAQSVEATFLVFLPSSTNTWIIASDFFNLRSIVCDTNCISSGVLQWIENTKVTHRLVRLDHVPLGPSFPSDPEQPPTRLARQ
ncbi:MAG: hypothetical protein RLZ25_575 [Pseudomonadota bacterium]